MDIPRVDYCVVVFPEKNAGNEVISHYFRFVMTFVNRTLAMTTSICGTNESTHSKPFVKWPVKVARYNRYMAYTVACM